MVYFVRTASCSTSLDAARFCSEESGAGVSPSHTFAFSGRRTALPYSGGWARWQVQPRPKGQKLWWCWRRGEKLVLNPHFFKVVQFEAACCVWLHFVWVYIDHLSPCVQREPRRRSYNTSLTIPHVVRPVEDITQAELDNICVNVREKTYNRATVSVLQIPSMCSINPDFCPMKHLVW